MHNVQSCFLFLLQLWVVSNYEPFPWQMHMTCSGSAGKSPGISRSCAPCVASEADFSFSTVWEGPFSVIDAWSMSGQRAFRTSVHVATKYFWNWLRSVGKLCGTSDRSCIPGTFIANRHTRSSVVNCRRSCALLMQVDTFVETSLCPKLSLMLKRVPASLELLLW